jgi:hypothetical protein
MIYEGLIQYFEEAREKGQYIKTIEDYYKLIDPQDTLRLPFVSAAFKQMILGGPLNADVFVAMVRESETVGYGESETFSRILEAYFKVIAKRKDDEDDLYRLV